MDEHISPPSTNKLNVAPRVFTLPLVVGLACGALVLAAQVAFFFATDNIMVNVIVVVAFIACASVVISSVLLFLASLPLLMFKNMRTMAVQWMISCVLTTAPSVLAFSPHGWLKNSDLKRIENNGEPLIAAIQQYNNANKRPPPNLEALVPTYIEKIPVTGNRRCEHFSYRLVDNSWELCVYLGIFFMSTRDSLVYWPSENYPDKVSQAKVERVGKWAYFTKSTNGL